VSEGQVIEDTPITLKVYAPDVLNLTLVDLPGIVNIPIEGHPQNMEEITTNLVMKYIQDENAIILAISPANDDLANSVALKAARKVDPDRKRTIGVLTKLDMMATGTNALPLLSNKVYPLKLGYYGVVNRSQSEIEANMSVEESQQKENQWFVENSEYLTYRH
jgi:dynamin 1-like protein